MKILYLSTLYAPHIGGGAEITLKSIVEGMRARGHEVSVLTTGPKPGLHQDEVDGVRVWRAGTKNLYWQYTKQRPHPLIRAGWHWRDRYNAAMRPFVREIAQHERPDVASCHNLSGWSISVWDELTAAGVPIIQVLHDLYLLCPRSTMFKKGRACEKQCVKCQFMRHQHREASRQVAATVGVSRYVLNRLVTYGYFANARRHVIHNARRIPDPSPRPTRSADAPLRFGYIGTLSQSKGVEWLIEQFQAQDLNATLTIAGRGQERYEQNLRRLADSRRVSFAGYVTPEDFYPPIDVCVVPSIWPDTFPGVAFEACAYHVPVIATCRGGLPEIIQDGVNGLLCDPQDTNSLARAMRLLATDRALLSRLAARARESVAGMLSMDRMLKEYEGIYAALFWT